MTPEQMRRITRLNLLGLAIAYGSASLMGFGFLAWIVLSAPPTP